MRETPDGHAWKSGRTALVPPTRALVNTLVAYHMKYRLGYEDDGWRGMIGCEVVNYVGASYNGMDVQLNGRCHYINRDYFERCT